jgi:hypothetical protein
MNLRRCGWCGVDKALDQFPADMTKRSGRSGVCTECKPPTPPVPDPVRKAMCTSKNRYPDQGTALRFALRATRRQKQMRVYQCPLCHGWHLTKKEAAK